MGRTHEEIMASLPKERREKIEAGAKALELGVDNEMVTKLIEEIGQNDGVECRDEAYKLIMQRIDELMDMNDGEGPDKASKDGLLLEVLSTAAERYEDENLTL